MNDTTLIRYASTPAHAREQCIAVYQQGQVLTGLGKSVFDYHSAQVREHQQDWTPLLHWLGEP